MYTNAQSTKSERVRKQDKKHDKEQAVGSDKNQRKMLESWMGVFPGFQL